MLTQEQIHKLNHEELLEQITRLMHQERELIYTGVGWAYKYEVYQTDAEEPLFSWHRCPLYLSDPGAAFLLRANLYETGRFHEVRVEKFYNILFNKHQYAAQAQAVDGGAIFRYMIDIKCNDNASAECRAICELYLLLMQKEA